eukprot:scaffold25040_cov130-Isochrysis_galbana.AAC.5
MIDDIAGVGPLGGPGMRNYVQMRIYHPHESHRLCPQAHFHFGTSTPSTGRQLDVLRRSRQPSALSLCPSLALSPQDTPDPSYQAVRPIQLTAAATCGDGSKSPQIAVPRRFPPGYPLAASGRVVHTRSSGYTVGLLAFPTPHPVSVLHAPK